MKPTILLACLSALPLATASAQTVRTVVNNGPSADLYDMVILGDGYTAADQARFDQDVLAVVNYFRTTPRVFPYGAYFNLYNVHSVFRASNQRGADKPPNGVFVDTAYDASYWVGGTERCLYIGDTSLASRDAALAPDTDGRVIVLVNDSKYGGCAGAFSVSYNGSSMEDVQAHEWGHSFAGLADEYDYGRSGTYSGGEPGEPNLTTDRTGARKWSAWLGHAGPNGTVGAYQGGGYYQTGLWRPEPDCEMRTLFRSFCTICREQMIKRFHQECVMFAAPTPSPIAAQRGGSVQVSFTNRLANRPHTIEWRVDGGGWQPGGSTFTWNVGQASAGAHTIEVRLTDTSSDVRQDPGGLLVHVHTWRVDVAASWLDLGITETMPAVGAGVEGNSSTQRPFGVAGAQRAMYAYGAGAVRTDRPVHVRAIAFRADATVTGTTGASWDFSLDVSTARSAPDALSRTFDDNHGADRVRVHDGSIAIGATSFGGSPAPFSIVVPFDEPFAWNPRSGPLLLDLRMRSSSGGLVACDAVTAAGGELARILHDTDANAATANFPATGTQPLGLVAQLILDAEVAPQSFATAEGPSSTSLGFDYNAAQRLMEIRDGAVFGLTGRHLITAIAWRPDAGRAWSGARRIDMRVELSTGPATLAATASPQFDLNHGPDRRVVFDGIWQPAASAAGGLAPFVLRLDLDRPFEFDPANASLVVDLHIRAISGGAGAPNDAVMPASGTRSLWAFGDPDAQNTFANQPRTSLLALVAVPHPVLPESADRAAGGIGLSRPWGAPGPGRSMTAYDASVLGVTEPVEISHLAWRLASGPLAPVTFDARIDLSSGNTLPLGPTFAANHGPDRATVFDGRFSATRAPDGTFAVEVELDTPFRWDPSRGPLVVDVRKRSEIGGGATFTLDAVASSSLSFAANTADPNATSANRPIATRGQVLRLGGIVGSNGLATPYGAGCSGTGTPPVAGTIGLPWLGNAGFAFAVFDARPNANTSALFGIGPTSTPLDPIGFVGCTLLTDALIGDITTMTDANGTARSAAGLPNAPALVGFSLTTQWVVLDPAGVNGGALSDGLRIEVR